MKILYYFIYPKKEGLSELFQNKPKRLMNALINKINNNEEEVRKLFKDDNKNETLKILEQIQNKLEETVFSADILTPNSKGVIALLEQIKKDLSKIYDIHQQYINNVEELENTNEKMKIGISGNISYENNNDYIKILDHSPFFFNHSIDDIKRKEAEKLLDDCDVTSLWLFFYNNKVEKFRRKLLKKIKNIYSEVKIDTEIDTNNFSFEESMFYKTKKTKEYINNLIDFFD